MEEYFLQVLRFYYFVVIPPVFNVDQLHVSLIRRNTSKIHYKRPSPLDISQKLYLQKRVDDPVGLIGFKQRSFSYVALTDWLLVCIRFSSLCGTNCN